MVFSDDGAVDQLATMSGSVDSGLTAQLTVGSSSDDRLAGFDLGAEEAGEAGAVVGGGAEADRVEVGPLQVEVDVVLPGEADAAVHLERR